MAQTVSFKWLQPIPAIIREVGINEKTAKFAAMDWYRLFFPFVPYREGPLSRDVSFIVSGTKARIRHLVPYAQRMYYGMGYRFGKSPHALATAYWDRAAILAGKKEVLIRDVQAYVKRKG